MRRLAVLAVGLLVAAGCTLGGLWQWDRHAARSAANATLEANAQRSPVPIAEALDDGDLDPGDAWTPVSVVGRYLPGRTVLLRNRPVEGRPAIGILEPFAITDGELVGRTLVVHRGWVAPRDDVGPDEPVPAPPGGVIEVVVRLRPGEPASGREPPPGQAQRIAPEQVLNAAGGGQADALAAYGVLLTEEGSAPRDVHPVPLPPTTFGPHLSYAFQWWVFALGALAGAVVLARRDTADGTPAGGVQERGPDAADRPRPGRRPRRATAEEEEDALVDAASRRSPTDPA